MTMKLDKQKIEPKLKEYSFFEVVPGVFSKVMENTKYGVDFGNNAIFRLENDNSKTYDDKDDENLVWLKKLCMDAMFKNPGGDCEELPENQTFEDIHGQVDEHEAETVEHEELTQEEKLKVAEMVQDNGYDKETATSIVKGEFKHESKTPATIPKGYVPKLNIQDVKMYLCPLATDQEAYVFLELCKARGLNPFTNEVYLIKYKEGDKAQAVVGKETFTRKAEQNPFFAGFEGGIIIRNEAGQVERREGTFYIDDEEVLGGWAKVHRNDKEYPFVSEVPLKEYMQYKKDGTPNKFWATKTATMIRKVALMQALREAFPSEFGGLYERSEIDAYEGETY